MIEASDNPLASMADQAVRSAISETAIKAMSGAEPGADAGDVVSSVFTGAVAAVARFAYQFQSPGQTPEHLASSIRDMVLGFLAQAEANDIGGRA